MSTKNTKYLKYACVAAIVLWLACSDGSDGDAHSEESTGAAATDAACPSATDLSYETFGRDFMSKYCTRCHDSAKTGSARMGAPPDHDFNTLSGVLAMAEHIDTNAAAGPNATNDAMPPDGDKPSEAERRKLGEWLACERAK